MYVQTGTYAGCGHECEDWRVRNSEQSCEHSSNTGTFTSASLIASGGFADYA